jgi:hypothetical protein
VRALIALLAGGLAVVGSPEARAAVKPGLAGAQELFQANRWEDARAHLRSAWASLPQAERGTATFLIGRSYAREAEFYRWLRRVGADVGLGYLSELQAARMNRRVAWIPLFAALYQLDAGRDREAERALAAAAALPGVTADWKVVARLRRAAALERLGRAGDAPGVANDASTEARYWRLVLTGKADPAVTPSGPGRRERLQASCLLFRASRAPAAAALLSEVSLDAPDVEESGEANKVLRFHDPLVLEAWERTLWERAVWTLRPLAVGGVGAEKALAGYYTGLGLFFVGAGDEAARYLKEASAAPVGDELRATARLLAAGAGWKSRPPAAEELSALWESTRGGTDASLAWYELKRPELAQMEPFASQLDERLRDLPGAAPERPSGAVVGRWGLVQLARGEDPALLGTALWEARNKSNKNKLEWNDPLLLLALSAADYRNQQYAQALETLFELSKTFPGLRSLQWNLQGVYAARQKAGGEARISQ